MPAPEETDVMKTAKILVTTTEKFNADEKSFQDDLVKWKSKINWKDVLEGPVIDLDTPLKPLVVFAERIRDDCVIDISEYIQQYRVPASGEANPLQHRLEELKAKAKTLHESFKSKETELTTIWSDMKTNKDKASSEEAKVATRLVEVDKAIKNLTSEAANRDVTIASLDNELKKIAITLAEDLDKSWKADRDYAQEKGQLESKRQEEGRLFSQLFMIRRITLYRIIQSYETSTKAAKATKESADEKVVIEKGHQTEKADTQRGYFELLANLNATKSNLRLQQEVLKAAGHLAQETCAKLVEVSGKWNKIVGNVGILNNRLQQIEEQLKENYLPTRAMASALVVETVNQGCMFLQYPGVEAELRATIEQIKNANDWASVETETLKSHLYYVEKHIEDVIKSIPAHSTELQWYPQALLLDEENYSELTE